MRPISHRYIDPLDLIWLSAAKKMGLSIQRSGDCYASYDGRGTLTLSTPEGMDPDDCLAQMILHEICHALVQGMQSFGWVDWGLDNEGEDDREREHACLRLQAALLAPFGLRTVLAPTTDFRQYYDRLPQDPFEERLPEERESILRARAAYARRKRRPVYEHLQTALDRTARLLTELGKGEDVLDADCLFSTLEPRFPTHASGLPLLVPGSREAAPATCGECAWSFQESGGTFRCRQAEDATIVASARACSHFERTFDCLDCGACCREAYDTVEVEPDDPAVKLHLPLLRARSGGYDLSRVEGRCTCLQGGTPLASPSCSISGGTEPPDAGKLVPPLAAPGGAPFTCSIYETRPRTCRDFTIFSEHCLSARRTVGLSR